jgi:hypothetical protein
MNWSIVFVGRVVLLVVRYIGKGWWGRIVERERRTTAQQTERRVFETWQEPPPDEHDTPDGGR